MPTNATPPRPVTVAFCEHPPDFVRQMATQALAGFDLRIPESDARRDVEAAAAGGDVLIARKRRIGSREMDCAEPSLIIALGRNPISVSLRAAAKRSIPVTAIPHPGAIAVADHTLGLLLAVARRIVEGDDGVRAGAYRERGLEPAVTTERLFAFNWLGRKDAFILDGLELGLVGFGAIGQEVARRALGFGMRVRYHQRQLLQAGWNRRLGVEAVAFFEELLETSDVLSLHIPHTPQTENLLDGARLDRMKPGAILVNTARGGLVDEAALAERLRDGRLGGAGLDVFREEPLPHDHPFVNTPRLVLAPHTGGAGAGGQRELFVRVAAAIREHAARTDGTGRTETGKEQTP